MRQSTMTEIATVLILLARSAFAEPAVYPSPGDLSSVEHLAASSDYAVKVNGAPCFVYETDNYWINDGRRPQDKAAFACFSFLNETVTIEVTCAFIVNSVVIRPKSDDVAFSLNGNTISFSLTEPKKLSIEVNDRLRPLFIFADEPEVPETQADHYFAPGVHHIGAKYAVAAKEHVYIAGGAVVEGTLLLGGDSIKVRGRGILSSGEWTWEAWNSDKLLSMFADAGSSNQRYHEYSGIVMLNSPGWFANGYGTYRRISNVKIIGWVGNTDGPHLNGNGVFENSFVFNNDDALITNIGDNNIFRNNVVWKGPWGRCIVSLNPKSQDGATWENIDIIGDDRQNPNYGVIAILGGDEYRRNFTYRNIRVEGPRAAPLFTLNSEGCALSNLVIDNVVAEDHLSSEGTLNALEGGSISGVIFQCLTLDGTTITSLAQANITQQGTVSGVAFPICATEIANKPAGVSILHAMPWCRNEYNIAGRMVPLPGAGQMRVAPGKMRISWQR